MCFNDSLYKGSPDVERCDDIDSVIPRGGIFRRALIQAYTFSEEFHSEAKIYNEKNFSWQIQNDILLICIVVSEYVLAKYFEGAFSPFSHTKRSPKEPVEDHQTPWSAL